MKFGIIGGLGAFASSRLYELINVEAVNQASGEITDSIFPELFIHQVPFNSTDSLGNSDDALFRQEMSQSLDIMELIGVDIVVFACNTLDYIVKELIELRNLAYISVADYAIDTLNSDKNVRSVVVMTSEVARFNGLYRSKLFADIRECEQAKVTMLIKASMAGKADEFSYLYKEIEETISENLVGCRVLLGCTELSAYSPYATIDTIDTLQLIASKIVRINNENSQ